MSWLWKRTLCWTTLLALELGLLTGAQAKPPADQWKSHSNEALLKLTINVDNQAGLEGEILQKAKKEAGRIFNELGIGTEWLDCPLESVQPPEAPNCQLPGFDVISLRLFPRLRPLQGGFRSTHMGVALVEEQGRVFASVFYERVADVAESAKISTGKVLGHAMAHEIGHLLLGSNSHTAAGLMKANWKEGDLRLLDMGRFRFSQKQGSTIRTDVLSRNSQVHSQMTSAARPAEIY